MLTEEEVFEKDVAEMDRDEIIERIVRLGFWGDQARYDRFIQTLKEELPEGTEVALRGSVVTGEKHEGGHFDADGPGTSDLDVTLLGDEVMEMWDREYFYIPRVNTKPLSDECPEACPPLNDLRCRLQLLVRRPVNFQAMARLFLQGRDKLAHQPYFKIVRSEEGSETATT